VLNPILCVMAKQFSRTLYYNCTKGENSLIMNSQERHLARYERRKAKRELKRKMRSDSIGGIENALSYGELYKAGKKCCNAVRWKNSVQRFEMHLFSGTAVRVQQIQSGKWKPSAYVHFLLTERGKTRPIDAPRVQDRQVHKAYTKNVLLPLYTPSMIYNNGASLEGKGFEFSKEMLKSELRSHYRKYGRNGSIILMDFKQFFPSAPHSEIYKRHDHFIFDNQLKVFGDRIVGSVKGGVGMPLGVEPSQAEMIALPSAIDNYIKCQLSLKGAGHYMDDYYIIVPPDRDAKEIMEIVLNKVNAMGLTISTNKSKIIPLTKPFRYCKAKYILTETGKVIINGNRTSMKRARRKIKSFKNRFDNGEMSADDLWCSVNGMLAYFEKYNDHKKLLRLRRLFYAIYGFSSEKIENFRNRKNKEQEMKYIVHRRFKEKAICGNVNLPYGTECESVNGMLYYNNKPLCVVTSENAHQYFARNDDGFGLDRGKLTQGIQNALKQEENHQERWDRVWGDKTCAAYKRQEHADHWLWNHAFFNADLITLNYIAGLVGVERK